MINRTVRAAAFLLSLGLLLLPQLVLSADFCWKGSYGRGVGTIPTGCTGGRNLEAGMCYTPCKPGWEGAVTMCLRQCPSGYVNTGLTCHVGKPLLIGANVDVCGMKTSCPSGYTNAGLLCGLNTPSVPPGYSALVDGPAGSGLDLKRDPYDRGIGLAPTGCESGKENSIGLCYPTCNTNFAGVGPVCWGQCPRGWVQCGMGCARNANACGMVVTSQVASVGMSAASIASEIATLGASAGAIEAANSTKIAWYTKKLNDLKKLYEANKAQIKAAQDAAKIGSFINSEVKLSKAVTLEEIAQASAELAGLLDPTGLVSAGAAYVYPTCDKVQ